MVQVYPGGIRLIPTATNLISQWSPPGNKTIVTAAINQTQVVIAMTGRSRTNLVL